MSQIDHRQWVTGWNEIATRHAETLPGVWSLATDFLDLHVEIVDEISQAVGSVPGDMGKSLLVIAALGANTYLASIGHVFRGEFDVAALLVRSHFDLAPLSLGVARDDGIAKAFLQGELRASTVRRRIVEVLRAVGEETLTEETERTFRRDASAADILAHANAVVANMLVQRTAQGATPVVGGRFDADQLRVHAGAVFANEIRLLTNLGLGSEGKPAAWDSRLEGARNRYSSEFFDLMERGDRQ